MNSTVKIALAVAVASTLYRYRYKILNTALKNQRVSKWGVNSLMSIPGIRSKMIETAFRK